MKGTTEARIWACIGAALLVMFGLPIAIGSAYAAVWLSADMWQHIWKLFVR